MLPSMSRALVLAILIGSTGCAACGNGSKSPGDQGKAPSNASGEEKISVPGGKGAPETAGPGSAATPASAGIGNADDPRFHLKPEEGSITVDKAEGKAGAERGHNQRPRR